MNKSLKQFLYWTPRVIGILIVLLLTLFSLDVFESGYTFWESIFAFLMHMLPALAILLALILAWRWEWVGAAGFIGFALWYISFALTRDLHWSSYAILTGIPILAGILFLVGWFYREQLHDRTINNRLTFDNYSKLKD